MAALSMLEEYHISPTNGFLPAEPPLERLPKRYERWEGICSDLPTLIQSGQITNAVDELPLCSTEWLNSEPEWRRAYVLLGFIANAYLWGPEKPANRLPASLSIPFLAVSEHLGIPPVPTFAAQNLWNIQFLDPTQPMHDPANISTLVSFTGAPDESWFFAVPAAIEARGAPMISLALAAFEAASSRNAERVIDCLNQISGHLEGCTHILPRMYERNNPSFFYNRIRPFLLGTQVPLELSDGVYYEEENGEGRNRQYKGPTAAESSLWHFVDIALGVSHDDEFLLEMRQYMPGPHRRFLAHVAKIANIREYVTSHPQEIGLYAAFNKCLECLVAFRNKHVQMVSRYIVVPSRASSKASGNNNKTAVSNSAAKGTGGATPVEFLKQIRDETLESRVRG